MIPNVEGSYNFGNSCFKVKKTLKIPCSIEGYRFNLLTDVIEGDIPWLMGKETMAKMDMKIDVKRKTVVIGALSNLVAKCTVSKKGHLLLKVREKRTREEVWYQGRTREDLKNGNQRKNIVWKLHAQFGHPSIEKLWTLISEAYRAEDLNEQERKEIKSTIKTISETCQVCLRFKRTPSRPVVGFSLGKNFNDVLSIDLGELQGERFILMIDHATRYCQATWIKSKQPTEIVRALLNKWIGIFGPPKELLSDNGLEFMNEDVKDLCERFGIRQIATAAESPWSNGLCERTVV